MDFIINILLLILVIYIFSYLFKVFDVIYDWVYRKMDTSPLLYGIIAIIAVFGVVSIAKDLFNDDNK